MFWLLNMKRLADRFDCMESKNNFFLPDRMTNRYTEKRKGLDHRFVQKDITTSLQDLKGFEYSYRWLKHTGYTHHIPYGILEDGRNDDQGQ